VKCNIAANGRFGGYTVLLQFVKFSVIPYENNIYRNSGDPSLLSFHCDPSGISTAGSVSCSVSDVPTFKLPGWLIFFFFMF
jgi:hypothetical protein